MLKISDINNKILHGDVLNILKSIPSESINMCITSPPYWNLRDYGRDGQLGNESTFQEYIDKLIMIFNEVHRVLIKNGSCWINIGDIYSNDNRTGVKKQSLLCIPDRFKLSMLDSGWLCRNEIIWHKPNSMPSSAKTRFNNDFEKVFFFTKDDTYFFNTQYEKAKTKKRVNNRKTVVKNSKYINEKQESEVRQGMNKERGFKLIQTRPKLPTQEEFVNFIRNKTSINIICDSIDIKRTKVEHWFRKDIKGFAFPSVEDWKSIKHIVNDFSPEFEEIDKKLTYIEYETDDINKNLDKGRLKRAVWSINTKPFKGGHFAPYPEELIETPIKACCPSGGIVLDIFMGSGTTGVVAKKLGVNYIGIDLNEEYIKIAENRIENI